jgi:hypothetical protein
MVSPKPEGNLPVFHHPSIPSSQYSIIPLFQPFPFPPFQHHGIAIQGYQIGVALIVLISIFRELPWSDTQQPASET